MFKFISVVALLLFMPLTQAYNGDFEEFDYLECMKILAEHLPHSMKKLRDWPTYVCRGILHPDDMKTSDYRFPLLYKDCIEAKLEQDKREKNYFGTAAEQCFYQSVVLRMNSYRRAGPLKYQPYTPVPIRQKSYMRSDPSNLI